MQVIDFIVGLRMDLIIITNRLNLTDLNEVEETVKNVKNASLINKNIMAVVTSPAIAEVKKLKA